MEILVMLNALADLEVMDVWSWIHFIPYLV